MIPFIIEQLGNPDWGAIGITLLIAIASSYLVWQVATGDLTEDQ